MSGSNLHPDDANSRFTTGILKAVHICQIREVVLSVATLTTAQAFLKGYPSMLGRMTMWSSRFAEVSIRGLAGPRYCLGL